MGRYPLKLAIFDIDGTLRRVRDPWIHLHNHLGVADLAKDFPERWQKGEISYDEWAELDAGLWRGYSREKIVGALELNPFRVGARELAEWFNLRSIPCVGISSGLSIFNDITAEELKFMEIVSNELQFKGNICSGKVAIQVNEENKGQVMDRVLQRYGAGEEEVVAFGDGTAAWDHLEQVSDGHYLDFEAVVIYVLRWDMIARWTTYDGEEAVRRFDELVEQAMAGLDALQPQSAAWPPELAAA